MLRAGLYGALGCLACGLLAASAQASFHEIKVREIATNPAGANSSYVELQMYTAGQNLVAGHDLVSYTASGTLLGTSTIPSNVPNGQSQRTVLIGGPAAPGSPDYVDVVFPTYFSTISAGGAVCWENLDCVSWGNFTGAALLPSPPGNPAPAIPSGSALRRSICAGNSSLLEAGDDTNNSAADFSLTTPNPTNNSGTIAETGCAPGKPNQTLTAKKKQDVDKAAIFDTLDSAGTVTAKGKVKVPGGSRVARFRTVDLTARVVKAKKATKSLGANVKTKIKIKFSSNAKKKVKTAIEDSGPRKITVTVVAKNAGGSTTKKIRFKLTD